MTLKVVNGGKTSAAANGAGSEGGDFEEHPLADLLWRAVYPKDAVSFEQIRERMSKLGKLGLSRANVHTVVRHVRDNPFEYGWMIPFVQKGCGDLRRYFPILVDHDGEITLTDQDHLVYFQAGTTSIVRNMMTEGRHLADQLEILAGSPHLSRAEKRKLRGASAVVSGVVTMLPDVIKAVN